MDRYPKKIIAWEISEHITTELAIQTLDKALKAREILENLILHSDQGSQFTSHDYNQLLEIYHIRHSYSRKGYSYHT